MRRIGVNMKFKHKPIPQKGDTRIVIKFVIYNTLPDLAYDNFLQTRILGFYNVYQSFECEFIDIDGYHLRHVWKDHAWISDDQVKLRQNFGTPPSWK